MNRKWVLGTLVVAMAAVAGFTVQRLLADRATIVEQSASDAEASAAVGREARARGKAGSNEPARGRARDGADAAHSDGSGVSAPNTDSAGDNEPAARPIPETVPAIELPDRDGVARQLSGWKGRPVLINFWATWCGPCRDEIPLLKTLRHQRTRDRLEVVGIAIDQRDAVLKYAREIGIDYPILIGEKEGYAAAEAFGVSLALPFSVFADSKGRIVTLKIGELHANEAEFILDRVRDVDTRQLELAAARQRIADHLRDSAVERGKQAADKD